MMRVLLLSDVSGCGRAGAGTGPTPAASCTIAAARRNLSSLERSRAADNTFS